MIHVSKEDLTALINAVDNLKDTVVKESGNIKIATSQILDSTEGFPQLLAYNDDCNKHAHELGYKCTAIDNIRSKLSFYLKYLEQGGK